MSEGTSLSDLIERLEKATGPDRELDAIIHCSCIPHPQGFPLKSSGYGLIAVEIDGKLFGSFINARSYTSSIDAAMTLVPEGMACGFSGPTRKSSGVGHEGMFFGTCGSVPDDGFHIAVIATSPALALCIAALKARLATTRDGVV